MVIKKYKFLFLLLLTIGIYTTSFAQCDPNIDPFCDDPDNPVPIDNQAIFLVITGAAYGMWKLSKKNPDPPLI